MDLWPFKNANQKDKLIWKFLHSNFAKLLLISLKIQLNRYIKRGFREFI